MKRKIRLILIGEKNGISLHFLESPEFFFMSLQIFLYQRLAGLQRREKIGQAVKNSRAGREMGIACKHHFKYLSPPSSLPTSRKQFSPFKVSKCVAYKSITRLPDLTLHVRSQVIDFF